MFLIKSWLACLAFLVATFTSVLEPSWAYAQATDGEPIYLEEPEEEPPARPGPRKTVKEVYQDKSVRAERQVVKMSDDTVVSDGKYTEYYPDGEKYVVGTYKLGVFDGEWSYWYPNGQLRKTIAFKGGKPVGQWEVFRKDGKKMYAKGYQDGKRHGKWITYYADGETPRVEVDYVDGQIDGQRITYYESGEKRQEINFTAGKMDGMMTEWTESGQKRAEVEFKEGVRGEIKRFDVSAAAGGN